jgi:formylglycine-generating enzyme required for sulfatase activity
MQDKNLKNIFKIKDHTGERIIQQVDFPFCIGGGPTADIHLPGMDEHIEAAYIGLAEDHPFVQPAETAMPVLYNGEELKTSAWLMHGDIIAIGSFQIEFRVEKNIILFDVQRQELFPSETPKAAFPRAGSPPEITPITFRSDHLQQRTQSSRRLKFAVRAALGLILLVLFASAWFVFTARQVVIRIQPIPDRVSVIGGIASPKIGAYYLLRTGTYTLQAHKSCYKPLQKQFVVVDDKNQMLDFSMHKLPGRLSLEAHRSDKPSVKLKGAQVSIDGQKVGRTPLAQLEVNPGRRNVEIQAENYQHLQTELVVEGCDRIQNFDLALVPNWSEITISSIPDGATVWVDGKSIGTTPLNLDVLAGDHELELKADRFKPWRTRLDVVANQPQVLDTVQLQPADGKLTVRTQPAGANVMLENTFAGQTPVELNLTADEPHSIHISKAGYGKVIREVKVGSSESKTITVPLKPNLGVIYFAVEPPDAEIVVNGKSKGRVPREIRLVAVEHQLEIRKQGYQSYRTRIIPRPGFPQEIKVALSKKSAAKKTGARIIKAKNDYELKLVRPQSFTMGSSRREQGRRTNETLRKIKLQRAFYMGVREVTNREFRQYLAGHDSGTFKRQSLNRDDLPVVQVTWEQAALFCNWLSAKDSLPPAYIKTGDKWVAAEPMGIGYRLPTEAEWEYCARFSTSRAFMKYPWGDKFPPNLQAGNYADVSAKDLLSSYLETYNDGYAIAAPPAKFKANALGLHDLGGNAAEWCHDYYSILPYSAGKIYVDPMGPNQGKHRVIKGSSWKHASISELRGAYRDYSNSKRSDLGFRICRYLN